MTYFLQWLSIFKPKQKEALVEPSNELNKIDYLDHIIPEDVLELANRTDEIRFICYIEQYNLLIFDGNRTIN